VAVEAVETPASLYVLESEYIAEILDPKSDRPVAAGDYGELVLTNLGRVGSPVIRYRTGDLVKADTSADPRGIGWLRLAGGVLGRADDMIHVRGNNLYPTAIEAIVRRFVEVVEYRLVVDHTGPLADLRIEIEPAPGAEGDALADAVGRAVRDDLLFRVEVRLAPRGSLPRYEMKAKRLVHVS
jgi:phenylacetate-CoA ligase